MQPPPPAPLATAFITTTWTFTGLALTVLTFRIYTSITAMRAFSLPDYLMVLSMLIGLASSSLTTVAAYLGIGHHVYNLTYEQISVARKFFIIGVPFSVAAAMVARVSCATYILRLCGPWRFNTRTLYFCIVFTTIVNLIDIILNTTDCGPNLAVSWGPDAATACNLRPAIEYNKFQGAANAVVDLVLTFIPTWIVYNLILSLRVRVRLMLVLGSSLFATIAAVARTTTLAYAFRHLDDLTHSVAKSGIWASVENNIIIITASIPAIRPWFKMRQQKDPVLDESTAACYDNNSKSGYITVDTGTYMRLTSTMIQLKQAFLPTRPV